MNKVWVTKNGHSFAYQNIFQSILDTSLKVLKITGDTEVNVILVTPSEMQKLSRETRLMDKVTDILSFPANYKEIKKIIGYNMLGDIYLCLDKLSSQAKEFGHSKKREVCYIFTHGLLHLYGYDHKTKEEETVMNAKADKIMKVLNISR